MKEAPVPMMITNFTRPGFQAYLIPQHLNQRLVGVFLSFDLVIAE
jgi:hypothetical protein